VAWTLAAVTLGVVVAGLWTFRLADGFGREVVAGHAIGDTAGLANSFDAQGMRFGFVFAWVAGLAATFTACDCVVYALLPGLTCTTEQSSSRQSALKTLAFFTVAVTAVGAAYGMFIGLLGARGRHVRLSKQPVTTLASARGDVPCRTDCGLSGAMPYNLDIGHERMTTRIATAPNIAARRSVTLVAVCPLDDLPT
jgi:hypothetical protein